MAILVFSAVMLSPKMPKEYPPKAVLEQRADIAVKEIKLKNLINKIEYVIKKDSLKIAQYEQ